MAGLQTSAPGRTSLRPITACMGRRCRSSVPLQRGHGKGRDRDRRQAAASRTVGAAAAQARSRADPGHSARRRSFGVRSGRRFGRAHRPGGAGHAGARRHADRRHSRPVDRVEGPGGAVAGDRAAVAAGCVLRAGRLRSGAHEIYEGTRENRRIAGDRRSGSHHRPGRGYTRGVDALRRRGARLDRSGGIRACGDRGAGDGTPGDRGQSWRPE